MKEINKHIELKFYQVFKHKISIQEFENWVYETKALESEFPQVTYIELVSLNYKDKYVYNELKKIIEPFIDFGKFERNKDFELFRINHQQR